MTCEPGVQKLGCEDLDAKEETRLIEHQLSQKLLVQLLRQWDLQRLTFNSLF